MVVVWSDEIVEQLKGFAARGLSAAQAAQQFEGMTRAAAVGLAHRKKFHFQSDRNGKRLTAPTLPPPPNYHRRDVTREPPPSWDAIAPRRMLTILDLEPGDCRWPIGDPQTPEFRFCGKPQLEAKPYCPACCRIAYESPEARRDAARKAGDDRRVGPPLCPR